MILSHTSGLPLRHDDEATPIKFQFMPGTEYGYSGPAIFYLQRVIEKLTNSRDLKEKKAVVYLSNGKGGHMLADTLISPHIGLTHSKDYFFEKYGFIRSYTPKWKAIELERMRPMIAYMETNREIHPLSSATNSRATTTDSPNISDDEDSDEASITASPK